MIETADQLREAAMGATSVARAVISREIVRIRTKELEDSAATTASKWATFHVTVQGAVKGKKNMATRGRELMEAL
jgi:predicted DNA-binding helix-hairpin-helix protein